MRVFFLLLLCSSFLSAAELRRTDIMPYRAISSEHQVASICYSKDGKILFVGTAGRGDNSFIELYNESGEKFDVTFTNPVPVDVLDSSPDNRSIAYACDDACKICDLESASVKLQLKGNPNNHITSLEYDNEGNRLLIGYKNGGCNVWDLRTKNIHRIEAHDGELYSARWCPDNSYLATLGIDKAIKPGNTIKLWDCKGFGLVKSEKRSSVSQGALGFNRVTGDLICAGVNMHVYEPVLAFSQVFNLKGTQEPTGGSRLIEDHAKPKVHSLAFIPGNKDYVIAGVNDGSVCLCNRNNTTRSVLLKATSSGEKLPIDQVDKALAVSPDGQTLAVGSYFEGMVRLWKINELLPYLKGDKPAKPKSVSTAGAHRSGCCIIN